MNPLPYLASLAMRHAWAEREYARLHADIVEARLTARARQAERGTRMRRWLLDGVPDRIGGRRRAARPRRRPQAAPYCARAAAHSAGAVRLAGGAR
ncbi:hypothetical protein [Actinomadura monticuli]|uniref:Uncharacterized protein n=1 Tax=Actinomadura monticuli TaxID=3097367 RepID=A0ABV4Q9P7_9ACTN